MDSFVEITFDIGLVPRNVREGIPQDGFELDV
jgi:hypothetical protein